MIAYANTTSSAESHIFSVFRLLKWNLQGDSYWVEKVQIIEANALLYTKKPSQGSSLTTSKNLKHLMWKSFRLKKSSFLLKLYKVQYSMFCYTSYVLLLLCYVKFQNLNFYYEPTGGMSHKRLGKEMLVTYMVPNCHVNGLLSNILRLL